MRPLSKVKLWFGIGLLAGIAIIVGCGSGGDLLDESGTMYSAYAVPQYNDEDVQEIDVVTDDCDGETEAQYPFDAKIVITTGSSAADFYIKSYDVYFRANEGTYCEESEPGNGCRYVDLSAAEMPNLEGTVLNPRHHQYSSPLIEKNSEVTLEGILIWTQGDKFFYVDSVLNSLPFTQVITNSLGVSTGILEEWTADMTYDMQVVLHCQTTENKEITITTPWTPVHFADFDNC